MLDGKKTIAESIVYNSLDLLSAEVNEAPLMAFNAAVENIVPKMEVKSRRVGGSTYQVPIEVKHARGISLAMDWLIQYARSGNGKSMQQKLSQQLIDAYNNVGSAAKKRDDTHKMAEANKAFSHFRF